MVYTRSQLSLRESPSGAGHTDGDALKGTRGRLPKRKRKISRFCNSSTLDESFGSNSTRSSGSPSKPELRRLRATDMPSRSTKPRKVSRLMKYNIETSRGSTEERSTESKLDLLSFPVSMPDSTSAQIVTKVSFLVSEEEISQEIYIGQPDSEISNEHLCEDSSHSYSESGQSGGATGGVQSVAMNLQASDGRPPLSLDPHSITQALKNVEDGEIAPDSIADSSAPLCSIAPNKGGMMDTIITMVPSQVSQEDPQIDEIMAFASVPLLVSPLRKIDAVNFIGCGCEYDSSCTVVDVKVTQESSAVCDLMKRCESMPEINSPAENTVRINADDTKFEINGISNATSSNEAHGVVGKRSIQPDVEESEKQLHDNESKAAAASHSEPRKDEPQIRSSFVETQGEQLSEVSSSDLSTESSLDIELNGTDSRKIKFPVSTSDLMLRLNSDSEYDSSVSNTYSESESTPVTSSDSEDTRSPSPTDLAIPVLYTFDDSHDSVLEVTSSTNSNNRDMSPAEKSPPVLTCIQTQSSRSKKKMEPEGRYGCAGCNKKYLLLYPFKTHVAHCCPDLAPKGLPLTSTEKRKKIDIFSPQYIENVKFTKNGVGSKKRISKLVTVSSPARSASSVSSNSSNHLTEVKRKSASSSQSSPEESKNNNPEINSRSTKLNASSISTVFPMKIRSNCGNSSTNNTSHEIPTPGRLWSADTPMQLYKKKYSFCSEKSRLMRRNEANEPYPCTTSRESKKHHLSKDVVLSPGPEMEQNKCQSPENVLTDRSPVRAEIQHTSEASSVANIANQIINQLHHTGSLAVPDTIATVAEELPRMESKTMDVSDLDTFFWEVVDHIFVTHMEYRKNATSDQGFSSETAEVSPLIPVFGQTLSNSIPPVSFSASYPEETPEENLAHVLIQLELNQPSGFYCQHKNRIETGFNSGKRNGWLSNGAVPRFLAEAQKSVFKIPPVPARSKVAKKRIVQDVSGLIQNRVAPHSKGKLESYLECTGKMNITAEQMKPLTRGCNYPNATGGRGEKNLKSIEDEYHRMKDKDNMNDEHKTPQSPAKIGQNKVTISAPSENVISTLDRDYRLIVQQLDGPPSPIFADDG